MEDEPAARATNFLALIAAADTEPEPPASNETREAVPPLMWMSPEPLKMPLRV